jgi:hypothetical protein
MLQFEKLLMSTVSWTKLKILLNKLIFSILLSTLTWTEVAKLPNLSVFTILLSTLTWTEVNLAYIYII